MKNFLIKLLVVVLGTCLVVFVVDRLVLKNSKQEWLLEQKEVVINEPSIENTVVEKTEEDLDWISKAGFSPEYEKRFRKSREYFYDTNFGRFLVKDIDKDLLLARQYEQNSYTAEDYTLLNTDKLVQITKEEFENAPQEGVAFIELVVQDPDNENVHLQNGCINLDLDSGDQYSVCNPPEGEYGVYHKYVGYIPEKQLYVLSWFIEEKGTSFVSKEDGKFYSTSYPNTLFLLDDNLIISYSDTFNCNYCLGGINVNRLNEITSGYEESFNFKTYGGYSGAESWGIKDVKIISGNTFYFQTVAHALDETQKNSSREVYSYFRQDIE